MYKRTRWIISAVMVGGLLLTGTAMVGQNAGPPPAHATLTADTALGPPPMPANLSGCPTLSEGDHGGCVSQLQTELNIVDHARLPVIGTFGRFTKHAVINFQWKYRILPANGVAGPHTKALLSAASDAFAQRVRKALQFLAAATRKLASHTPGSIVKLHNSQQTGSVHVCHPTECSWYVTRAQTRQLNAKILPWKDYGQAGVTFVCALLGGVPAAGLYLAASCGFVGSVYFSSIVNAISHAAAENGCLRLDIPRSLSPYTFAMIGGIPSFSADDSSYCHNT